MRTRQVLTGFAGGVVATVLVGTAAWLLVVYTGAYDVAATDRHADLARWTLETTMRNSVEARADEVEAPASVSQEDIAAGARLYADTCAHCHGGPGIDRANWATHMLPEPPRLVHAAAEWETREVFWIVKHGVKMTGMPAFGPEHDDSMLWGVTAFVEQLPGMTEQQYRSMTGDRQHTH